MSFPLMPNVSAIPNSQGAVNIANGGSFVVPSGITSVSVYLVGAGGGGGAGQSGNPFPGGTGGRGALVLQTSLAVTPGETLTVSGGIGGAGTAFLRQAGGGGSTISLLRGGTTLMSAGGGGGGQPATRTGSGDDLPGTNGNPGFTGSGGTITTGGGAGGGAGTTGAFSGAGGSGFCGISWGDSW